MSITRLKIENLSKQYRLGEVGTGSLSSDLNRFWHKLRGKEDPYSLVGVENDRSKATNSEYVWALQDVNLEVKEGEVLGIIGKNGAGKSTLLKILSQVTGPTKGEIKINGRIGSLLEVGTGMHPELTGRENIYLNGAILGMSKAEIRKNFDAIVDFAGIAAYVDTPFKRYSSGMRVRLGFAVAAFLEPEILIVDEVLAVGDAEFQRKAIGKMKEVSGGHGRTVLFVSHNMSSIKTLCDRAILLNNGIISAQGNTDEIVDLYFDGNDSSGNEKRSTFQIKNGLITLDNIAVFNANKKESPLYTSDPIILEIDYTNNSMDDISCTIQIDDYQGNKLITIRGGTFKRTQSDKLQLRIPENILNDKKFRLNMVCSRNQTFLDRIENFAIINVNAGVKELGSYFGQSKYPLTGNFIWK